MTVDEKMRGFLAWHHDVVQTTNPIKNNEQFIAVKKRFEIDNTIQHKPQDIMD